ncbi:MAG: hypothetical protein JSW41_02005, partial [Candidatus Aenigmatarchaeota archaeon]
GTAYNGASQNESGYLGDAFEFGGFQSDDYIGMGTTYSSVIQSQNFTVSAWAKSYTTNYTEDVAQHLGVVFYWYRASGSGSYSITGRGDPADWEALCKQPPNTAQRIDFDESVVVGEWVHLAMVVNDSNMSLYFNGEYKNYTDV